MSETIEALKMVWLPDYPDYRDYTEEHENIAPMVKKIGIAGSLKVSLSPSTDLRQWCSPRRILALCNIRL